ncbi:Tat protein translocase TatB subunit [Haloactinopolyspora alba]|uniref:Sec-independent protein translocase protein TatB n=1 Tax=Haloactinopolyspora alba TaxID=648780 RepID=A0A2P8DXF2_9ACTN|nr:twin-arginine translocase TatA/TatE family subunit [Haloactinopolyspora alba]PSL01872.1 Tat protein translocase TatB subunit [Haloactinopolyspora alba]
MFDIGIGEVFVILVVALLVFGPDRLPAMAKQAASFVRDLRTMVANARRDLSGSVSDLGIDEDDLRTLSDLRNPQSFVRKKVLDGVDLGLDDLGIEDEPKNGHATNGKSRDGSRSDGSVERTSRKTGTATGSDASGDSTGSGGTDADAGGDGSEVSPNGSEVNPNGAGAAESAPSAADSADTVSDGAAAADPDTVRAGAEAPRFDPDAT